MVVLICEKVPERLRGELSRWMIEPKTNVFVGKMSAMVRDKLWKGQTASKAFRERFSRIGIEREMFNGFLKGRFSQNPSFANAPPLPQFVSGL